MENEREVVLEVEGVVKRFPGVLANDDVGMKLHRGEILALLGENGAGKSTLMNIIYGLYHPDEGLIRVKGREVKFASPREAIRSGIGMVHQHFQLVKVMTVADNVVLGEEGSAAYQGKGSRITELVMKYLPSLLLFTLIAIVGMGLGQTKYFLGSLLVGAAAGVVVAIPPLARLLWGLAWRISLVLVTVWIASQIKMVARVGLTDLALRQKVDIVDENRPKEMDGYSVKSSTTTHNRIDFDWRRERREADESGKGINGVIEVAKTEMAPYRDNGIPGWLLDAIDSAPPKVSAISVVLLALLFGWHGISTWRGIAPVGGRLQSRDLPVLAGLALLLVIVIWSELDEVSAGLRLVLSALTLVGLGFAIWQTLRRRYWAAQPRTITSPLDSVIDSVIDTLQNLGQIRNTSAAARSVRELSQQYGLEVDPDAVIEKLPVGTQQRVEIIKALYRHAEILILDEPTAVLTPQEGKELFKIMRALADQGVSIIFITHKLKEVFEVASNIVVMRGGRVVGATTPDEATEASLAAMMVGREVILQVEKEEAKPAEAVLEVDNLSAENDRGAKALNGVSFAVCAGEVLGIAGVQGNGQTELVEVLTGLRSAEGGSVKLLGNELQPDEQPEAKLWTRVFSFGIDLVFIAVATYFIGYFARYFSESTFEGWSQTKNVLFDIALTLGVAGWYFLACWSITGTTLGMAFFGLEFVRRVGQKKPAYGVAGCVAPILTLVGVVIVAALVRLVVKELASTGTANNVRDLILGIAAGLGLVVALFAVAWQVAYMLLSRVAALQSILTALGYQVIHRERITSRHIKDMGTSHVPEDRQRHGLVKDYSVADNLVLDDYYERPYAQEPNAAELPITLLRYALLFGLIVAGLTLLSLWAWDKWLWTAILDAFDVPESYRTYSMTTRMPADQQLQLQWPFIVSLLLLLGSELLFGLVAHLVTVRIFGIKAVSDLFHRVNRQFRGMLWRLMGRKGEPPEERGGLMRNAEAIDEHARQLIEQYDIRTPSTTLDGGNLSGGNQQKMIVAREFSREPRLLIAAQPTRGIDVGSIEFIHRQIIDQRDAGAAVLLVSAELDEIMALSDRIAVMYKGEIIDTLDAKDATREQLGLLMAGIKGIQAPQMP